MNEIVPYEDIGSPLSVETVKHQIQVIQQVMKDAMVDGTHYGVIPGTDKPTLLKAGAEKLCLTFRLAPTYIITKTDLGNGHREYEIRCTLTHIPSGLVFGEGVGVCSTHETKYRYRQSARTCPKCGSNAIIKGKEEFGGGWICYAKKGGCGAKFKDDDQAIVGQAVGRVENPDIADVYNTALKIGKKRAHVDAVLTATAASDIFAQDLEDILPLEEAPPKREYIPEQKAAVSRPKRVVIPEDVQNDVHEKTLLYLDLKEDMKLTELWIKHDADTQVALSQMFDSSQRRQIKEAMTRGLAVLKQAKAEKSK